MAYPGSEAFLSSLRSVAEYKPPESPDVVRKLSCALPDYRGFEPYRLRFLLGDSGVAFDILPPGPDVNEDSVLIMQMRQVDLGQEDFPTGELPIIFDSQLGLERNGSRLLVARHEGYDREHTKLLERAGLGQLVVANLTPTYGYGAPYGSDIPPRTVERAIPALPGKLLAMASPL